MYKGIAGSEGIGIGTVVLIEEHEINIETKRVEETGAEIERLQNAIEKFVADTNVMAEKMDITVGKKDADILRGHIQMLQDPMIEEQISALMISEKISAEMALEQVLDQTAEMFATVPDELIQQRATDLMDIKSRMLKILMGIEEVDISQVPANTVLVARDLTPSMTAGINPANIAGILTEVGGRTSHSAILARAMEIPAVLSIEGICGIVKNGDTVVLDGSKGEAIVNPDEATVKEYETKRAEFVAYKEELKKLVNEKTITTDGHQVELVANIGSAKDLAGVKENGGEGVGLFRTEFLYMESAELPTEEQQFEVYKEVLEGMEGKPVVVRTLDIGGDKEIEAIDLPKEMNPFLGVRAIRLCFQREDIFRTQLRALLRASVYGDLRIMFPMIATLQEFRKAKGILMEEKEKLIAEGVKVSDTLQVGIMIEIPAAAVLAHKFAKEVDFFSVGTNDLVQYTFAADRMSSGVSYLYQPFNPSILNLLKHVIDSAHAEGKWAGMCGEMAGEAIAAPLLLGLGLDEFSMSATSILAQRKLIKSVSKADMEALVEKALDCATSEEVVELVKSTVKM